MHVKEKYIVNIGLILILIGVCTLVITIVKEHSYILDSLEFMSLGSLLFITDKNIKFKSALRVCLEIIVILTIVFKYSAVFF